MRRSKKLILLGTTFFLGCSGGQSEDEKIASVGQAIVGPEVPPILIPGANNDGKSCAEVQPPGENWTEFKVDGPDATTGGTFSDGTLTVQLTNTTGTSFDFSSNLGIDAVIVKDGVDGANLYPYSYPLPQGLGFEVNQDDGLSTPFGGAKGISHVLFCYDLGASKSGVKFHDLDRDGVRDAGEPGLPGWVIYVDYNDNGVRDAGEPFATTAADGSYLISDINPGTWKVREEQQAGWTCSFPNPCYYQETFVALQTNTGNDFGNWTTATKSGVKFHDLNANGVSDAGEPGLPGWVIYVDYNDNGIRDAGEPFATTDATGSYLITGINPGQYKVREEQQAGWTCSYPSPCYHDELFLSGAALTNNDFGNWTTATKSGVKFHDLNANGVRDAGEPGLPGWVIYVDYDDDGIRDAGEPFATTDATGSYLITGIVPGQFRVREVLQAGWTCSSPNPCYYDELFQSGGSLTGNDFGNWTTGSKSGTKYYDFDPTDLVCPTTLPIAGFQIYLYHDVGTVGTLDAADTLVASQATNASGAYLFDNLDPGNYIVCEENRANYNGTLPANVVCAFNSAYEPGGYAFEISSNEDESNNNFCNVLVVAGEGCTPGYWKNHTDRWVGFSPNQTLSSVFSNTAPYQSTTLLQALQFGGGSGVDGAKRILLRAAVASLLNLANPDVDFSAPGIATIADLIAAVNAALASGNRATMLELASQLDAANNAQDGCPLSGTRATH